MLKQCSVLIGLCLWLISAMASAAVQEVDDLAYRSAFYAYQLKNYQKAQLILNQALERPAKETAVYYQMLLARVYVEQRQYQKAEAIFSQFELKNIPLDLRNHTLFALAKLYYAKNHCQKALSALDKTQKLEDAADAEARFIKASCMIQGDVTLEVITKAQALLDEAVAKERPASEVVWFAYGYYNLAMATAKLKSFPEMDVLFEKALDYTGNDKEGKALTQKILLSRANIYYQANRYDYAVDSYSKLPLNGYWQDQSLLGFGWAAFKNNQPSIALEAWRQLTNLPYKSMSVYQGYLLIPFAQERANAFLTALKSYENAVEQYTEVTDEIDAFSKKLNLQAINNYAVRYYHRNNRVIAPLHPLLVTTYTQPDFREAIETIGMLTGYKQKLANYQEEVQLLLLYQKVFQQQASDRQLWLATKQKQTQAAMDKVQAELVGLREQMIIQSVYSQESSPKNIKQYQEYLALSKQLKQVGGNEKVRLQVRVNRLQAVLFDQLAEDKKAQLVTDLTRNLIQRLHALGVRFSEYKQYTKQSWHQSKLPDVSDLESLIAANAKTIDQVLLEIETQLLDKTQQALTLQRSQIEDYKNQARKAATSLKEEFYQRGGSRLWY